jgi:hypothetical protein
MSCVMIPAQRNRAVMQAGMQAAMRPADASEAQLRHSLLAPDDDLTYSCTYILSILSPCLTTSTNTYTDPSSDVCTYTSADNYLHACTQCGWIIRSQEWVADSTSNLCMRCVEPFNFFFSRRHHCRFCGVLCCHACSSKQFIMPAKDTAAGTC